MVAGGYILTLLFERECLETALQETPSCLQLPSPHQELTKLCPH